MMSWQVRNRLQHNDLPPMNLAAKAPFPAHGTQILLGQRLAAWPFQPTTSPPVTTTAPLSAALRADIVVVTGGNMAGSGGKHVGVAWVGGAGSADRVCPSEGGRRQPGCEPCRRRRAKPLLCRDGPWQAGPTDQAAARTPAAPPGRHRERPAADITGRVEVGAG